MEAIGIHRPCTGDGRNEGTHDLHEDLEGRGLHCRAAKGIGPVFLDEARERDRRVVRARSTADGMPGRKECTDGERGPAGAQPGSLATRNRDAGEGWARARARARAGARARAVGLGLGPEPGLGPGLGLG